MLKEFGGGLELTENCARNVLKAMNWGKRKGTTGKVEPSKTFLAEEKFSFPRNVSNVTFDHDLPSALVLNLDQTCLFYVSPGKYTFSSKGQKMFPLMDLMAKSKLQGLL